MNPINKKLSEEEVDAYLHMKQISARNTAIGSVFCIYSVLPLFIILYLIESGTSQMAFTKGLFIGLVPLLILAFAGVAFFVVNLKSSVDIQNMENLEFSLSPRLIKSVKHRERLQRSKSVNKLILGLSMIIASAFPLLYIALSDFRLYRLYAVLPVSIFLIGIGVYQIVKGLIIIDSYRRMTLDGENLQTLKRRTKRAKRLSQVYWPLITGVYLAWSVFTMDWHLTWIIWPFAGIVFSAVAGILSYEDRHS
ncbi:hypothetical protein [Fusibacter sp. JL216-2]|uniref:hypothetical protein n=1 Tax=Fusibacter sp. JL216-2 TaxID=3071453 RepID=UPI003D33C22D